MKRLIAILSVTATLMVGSFLIAGPASAHVSVGSSDAVAGGYGVITFRVPNESDTAGTVGLRVELPADTPFSSVRTTPIPGWTVNTTTSAIDPPVTSGEQEISEAVTLVEWTAQAGTRIGPGEFGEFRLSVGPFPEADSVTFKAIQAYDDGSEVAWIEESADGTEPDNPAPILALAVGDGTDEHGGSGDAASAGEPIDTADAGNSGSGTATVALIIGIAGLVAGLAGLGLGLSARRRTVAE